MTYIINSFYYSLKKKFSTFYNYLFLLIFVGIISPSVQAQSSLPKGQSQLNIGLGLSDWGIPIYIGFDKSFHQDFTFGGEVSYRQYRENWATGKYNHNIIGIGADVNYHFNTILEIPSRWDFYGGLNVGVFIWNSPDNYGGNRASGLGIGAQIGGRYFFTRKVGVHLELGGRNVSNGGKIGLTIKL